MSDQVPSWSSCLDLREIDLKSANLFFSAGSTLSLTFIFIWTTLSVWNLQDKYLRSISRLDFHFHLHRPWSWLDLAEATSIGKVWKHSSFLTFAYIVPCFRGNQVSDIGGIWFSCPFWIGGPKPVNITVNLSYAAHFSVAIYFYVSEITSPRARITILRWNMYSINWDGKIFILYALSDWRILNHCC